MFTLIHIAYLHVAFQGHGKIFGLSVKIQGSTSQKYLWAG